MTVRLINPRWFVVLALVFAAGVTTFTLANGRGSGLPSGGGDSAVVEHPRTTDQLIASLQATVRAHPGVSGEYVLLADAYMQKVRETGDAGFYARADGVLGIARRIDPRS